MKSLRYAAGAVMLAVVAGYPFLALTYSTGAPAGFSGPEQNCSACHNDHPVNSGTGFVSITAPPQFTPGVPVQITVSVLNTTPPDSLPRQGFELSIRDAANTATRLTGFIVDGTTVQLAQGSPEFVTHTEASNTAASWTFQWLPPASPPEQVTIFAAGNASNGNGAPTGDHIYTTSLTIDRHTVAVEPSPLAELLSVGFVAPNPVRSVATLPMTLARPAEVTARVVDGAGRTVRVLADGRRGAGEASLTIEASGLPAGVYFVLVEAEGVRTTRRLTVAR